MLFVVLTCIIRLLSSTKSIAKPVLFCAGSRKSSFVFQYIVPSGCCFPHAVFFLLGAHITDHATPNWLCLLVLSGSFGDCADTRRKRKMLEEEGVRFENSKVSVVAAKAVLLKLCAMSQG